MSAMWFVLATVLGAETAGDLSVSPTPAASARAAAIPEVRAPGRRLGDIDKDCSALLREHANATTKSQRAAAIRKLTDLYREIKQDPRLEASDILKTCKAKLWSRLTRVQKDLQREFARDAKNAARDPAAAEVQAVRQATDSLASQMSLTNYTLGGPGYVFEQAGGAMGGGARDDYGEELIDLIQHTIAPTHWDTVGGPGSIMYYRPLMALVVRATAEVHGDVGGLLGALRRVGN